MTDTTNKVGTFKEWLSSQILMLFFRCMRQLPYLYRHRLMGALLRGPLGHITGYKKRTLNNLNLIYPDLSDKQKSKIANQVLDNAGRTFLENMYPAEFQAQNPKIELWGDGLENLLKAHSNGRPVIFFSGHFGNHEAFRAALYKHGIKVGGLIRPMSNPYFDYHYQKTLLIEGRSGPVFLPGVKGTLGFYRALKRGATLALLIDLAVPDGPFLSFLGQPARTALTAASFALKSNALFLPYFSMRNPDSISFSVEIGRPIKHSDPLTMTKEATKSLELRIKKDPGNWFWIHRRWKYHPKGNVDASELVE
jgi:KDO2-lipid IV(A) lauroyltransferase|tara:strand:+ start:2091 stop:3014 length:924 start_codon:yes stop_codon:yes gene_type:complete